MNNIDTSNDLLVSNDCQLITFQCIYRSGCLFSSIGKLTIKANEKDSPLKVAKYNEIFEYYVCPGIFERVDMTSNQEVTVYSQFQKFDPTYIYFRGMDDAGYVYYIKTNDGDVTLLVRERLIFWDEKADFITEKYEIESPLFYYVCN